MPESVHQKQVSETNRLDRIPSVAMQLQMDTPNLSWTSAWMMLLANFGVRIFILIDRFLLSCSSLFGRWTKKTPFRLIEVDPEPEPDSTVGPMLSRIDAPELFSLIRNFTRTFQVPSPTEIRLSYLPGCGVAEIREDYSKKPRRVLIIGLPCFQILTVEELQAVLAHEFAHLKMEDAKFYHKVLSVSNTLNNKLDDRKKPIPRYHPRSIFARIFRWWLCLRSIPVSHEMEFRADLMSSKIYGFETLIQALKKLTVIQPIFREIMLLDESDEKEEFNIYRKLDEVWVNVDNEKLNHFFDTWSENESVNKREFHPPVKKRISKLIKCKNNPSNSQTGEPENTSKAKQSSSYIKEIETFKTMLHNRIFGNFSSLQCVYLPEKIDPFTPVTPSEDFDLESLSQG